LLQMITSSPSDAVVPDVPADHDVGPVADDGVRALVHRGVDGRVLADGAARADADAADRVADGLILMCWGPKPEAGVGVDRRARADLGVAGDVDVGDAG
jgi:hypothetical protein